MKDIALGQPGKEAGTAMQQKTIDFRELLERILPLDELLPTDRVRVQRDIESGVSRRFEEAAYYALSKLEARGTLRRLPTADTTGVPVARYQPRDAIDVITVPLQHASGPSGIARIPRASLPARALASLHQVRRLLDLDDRVLFSPAAQANLRSALDDQLGELAAELLPAGKVTYVPADAPNDSLDPSLGLAAVESPGEILHVADTPARAAADTSGRSRHARTLAFAAVTSSEGQLFGHLELTSPLPHAFTPEDLSMLSLLADHAGGMLDRAGKIERLMFTDPMTSVYNRAYFDLQLQNEMARAERESYSMALAIVDIDDFKSFNTVYGYQAGNSVLTSVAHALRGGVRPFDTVARWGGEEFGVLLTAPVQADDVMTISERLRGIIGRTPVEVTGLDRADHRLNVTVSIGVALFPEHGRTPEDIWRSANQALLAAKRPPKNQVVLYAPGMRSARDAR